MMKGEPPRKASPSIMNNTSTPRPAKKPSFLSLITISWQLIVFLASLVAIALHFLLAWLLPTTQAFGFSVADLPYLLLLLGGGTPLAWSITKALFQGDFGADLLALIALLVASFTGEYLAASLVVLMLSSGQVLETYAMRKASSVLDALSQRMPSIAHRKLPSGVIEEITLLEINIDDHIVVYPHETVPVDGVVLEGNGTMDESYLTGEPYQVSKAPGASVMSGAVNGESMLVIQAEKLAIDSRYATITQVMQEAEQKRPAMRRLADQVGGYFTPVALIVASAAWYFSGDASRFLSVLIIATPCPLLIAVPVTLISAISMAAKLGIIIKDPTVLERLPTCTTAIFDKTGTLTYGQPALTAILPAQGVDSDLVLQQAASLERYSKHPLAYAILQAAEKANMPLLKAESVSEKPGQGLMGQVGSHALMVTHRKQLLKQSPELEQLLPAVASGLECVVLRNNAYVATFQFRDTPRSDGQSFIEHLAPSHQFNRIMLVSGDRESEVAYLAEELGITETLASQTPEQKLAVVRAEVAKAPTLFMGDGINDAPALTAATVGIAFGQHSSVTAEAAGAVIMENTLEKVDELIHISEAMRAIALQSAVGGMILSVLGMGFAAVGWLTPVQGALIQEVIDVVAIVNALRLTFGASAKQLRSNF